MVMVMVMVLVLVLSCLVRKGSGWHGGGGHMTGAAEACLRQWRERRERRERRECRRAGAYREVHVSCYLISIVSWCSEVCRGGSGVRGSADNR